MSALATVTALALAALHCDDLEASTQRLSQASEDSPARWEAALKEAEAGAGAVLLLDLERRELSRGRQVELAAERLATACVRPSDEPGRALAPDREALERIYRRAEFAHARQRNAHLLARLFEELLALLRSLAETSGAVTFAEWVRFAVLGFAALTAAAVVTRLAWVRRRRTLGPKASGRSPALVLDDPQVHLGRAQGLLAEEPRQALREGLLAMLAMLERRQLARPDRVRTNRELAEELPQRGAPPRVTEAVTSLARWYDHAYYSLERVDLGEAQRFLDSVRRLPEQLPEAHA